VSRNNDAPARLGKYPLTVFDQVVAAMNSYVILFPALLGRDFNEIAKRSIFISVFTLWQALARITVINEVLDIRNSSTEYFIHAKKMIYISSTSFLLIPFSGMFSLTINEVLVLSLVITSGLQIELARQYFLASNQESKAALIDLTWLTVTIILFVMKIQAENIFVTWFLGSISSLCLAFWLVRISHPIGANRDKVNKVNSLALTIPMILAGHTFFQNLILTEFHQTNFLGQLRAVQLCFLPAIFLMNIQQSIFVPLITQKNFTQLKTLRKRINSVALLFTAICLVAVPYVLGTASSQKSLFIISILVAFSVFLNLQITYESLIFVIEARIKILVFYRIVWLLIGFLCMIILVDSENWFILGLVLIDFFYLLALLIAKKGTQSIRIRNKT
jgi:hypothetical protein